MSSLTRKSVIVGGAAAAVAAMLPRTARAADLPVVRVGKAQAISATFLPLEIGQSAGIWQQVGIALDISNLRGDVQVQQGLTANSIDIGLGSGPGLGFLAKGVPAIGIAALAGDPYNMVLVVPPASPIQKAADLRGKRLAVSGKGSLTDWLAQQITAQQKWPADSIVTVPLGDPKAYVAAMKTGQVDGLIAAAELGYDLQERGQGRILINFGNVVRDFNTHIIFARNDFVAQQPDLVRRFLRGWFTSVAYMRSHRAESIAIGASVEGLSPEAMRLTYEAIIGMLSTDGAFDQRTLDRMARSFVELGILPTAPDPRTLITTKFVPVHV
jgi:ABC-type nitrate/sulfonate/bicarbonate transport system substrate-binding protein